MKVTVFFFTDPSLKHILTSPNSFMKKIDYSLEGMDWNAWNKNWVSIKFMKRMFTPRTKSKSSHMLRKYLKCLRWYQKTVHHNHAVCEYFTYRLPDLFHMQYNTLDGSCSFTSSIAENKWYQHKGMSSTEPTNK